MKTVLASLIAVFFFAIAASGQQPAASPKLPIDESEVVRISTNLIQIDMTATDPRGRIVTDLRPDEVEIYENGKKQKITGFNFVSATRNTQAALRADREPTAGMQPPVRPEQVRRTIALVVDDLSLSHESTAFAKKALRSFVDEQMDDGDLVAIIRSGAGIGSLQQFTSDKRILHAAIEKIKWNPLGTGGVTPFARVERFSLDAVTIPKDMGLSEEDAAEERNRLNAFNDLRGSAFAVGTLGTLRFVVTGMSELPGRKSVLMFSDGFRLFQRDRDGTPRSGIVMDQMRRLVDLANRASIVFYSVDPRGLTVTGLTAADDTKLLSAEGLRDVVNTRTDKLFETQAGLNFLARETGGFSLFDQNDLNRGLGRVLEDQSYYLLAYEPDEKTFNPATQKFNQIEVRILRKGVEARYRRGFFNNADRPRSGHVAGRVGSPQGDLLAALYSPFSQNDIGLRLNALFGSADRRNSFVRSLLHIDARDLTFTDGPDGSKKAAFDILAISFGADGQLVDQIGRTYELAVPPDAYPKFMADGFVYHFQFPVKKPGAFQYRVALRDKQSDRIGTASQFIEVPDLTKNRLTLSGIVLERLTAADYDNPSGADPERAATDAVNDTALRRIPLGTVLRYSAVAYNAKEDRAKRTNLRFRIRVYREGELVLKTDLKPGDPALRTGSQLPAVVGAIAVGKQMDPGDYILELIVIDEAEPKKPRVATQSVQFEVVG